jgi:cytochrome c peroxidase
MDLRVVRNRRRKDFSMRQKHVLGALTLLCAAVTLPLALAQSGSSSLPSWVTAAWNQSLSIPLLPTILLGKVPATLPQTTTTVDLTGQTTTYFPGGAVTTANNAFFQSLGTNGRTCFSCHQPQNNWSTTPATLLTTYVTTLGRDPVFSPVDGADCPTTGAAASTFGLKFIQARVQLFTRGAFRISLPEPANPQWASVTVSSDPTGCELSTKYGLPSGMLSFYRRPLPATNVIYTSPGLVGPTPNIMWDTRELSLASQFVDATLTHAQASSAPSAAEQAEGVAFQSGSFTAQSYDFVAGDLTGSDGSGAQGGGQNLYNYSESVPYHGPGAAFGGGACGSNTQPCPGSLIPNPAVPGAFMETQIFNAFANPSGNTAAAQAQRASINRGQVIFNSRSFVINGVTGFSDLGPGAGAGVGGVPVAGTCSRCHNNANVGNDSFDDPKHLGVGDNSYLSAAQVSANGSSTLPMTPDLPVFTFNCPVGSISYFSNPVMVNGVTYDQYQTTDPGVGWITGKCNDLGKFKVSSLRGIAARPPFFHGGEAATMRDVVIFYNNRFNMNLSAQDIEDLVNFLNAQ